MEATIGNTKTGGWPEPPKLGFLEYSSHRHDQHWITVLLIKPKRQVIGLVYRKYDEDFHKEFYQATDAKGRAMFGKTNDLQFIKDCFMSYAKSIDFTRAKSNDEQAKTNPDTRNTELKVVRGKAKDKDKNLEP
jgi:hypothetical protein